MTAAADTLDALEALYVDTLGLSASRPQGDTLTLAVGPATVAFTAAASPTARPFHHLALLIPGGRIQAAVAWLRGHRVTLLPIPDTGDTTIAFPAWQAHACYFEDPAGNIMELIAHDGIGVRNDTTGPFTAAELLGVSEVGLVVDDVPAAVAALDAGLGVQIWDDGADGHVLFAGRRAHTLILVPRGRPWLPTARGAQVHPIEVILTGTGPGEVTLPGLPYRVLSRR